MHQTVNDGVMRKQNGVIRISPNGITKVATVTGPGSSFLGGSNKKSDCIKERALLNAFL
jgi:hypothetical protein